VVLTALLLVVRTLFRVELRFLDDILIIIHFSDGSLLYPEVVFTQVAFGVVTLRCVGWEPTLMTVFWGLL